MSRKRTSKYTNKFKAGDSFGSWTVIDGTIHGQKAHLDVRCKCGNKSRVDVYSLVRGRSTNCGCMRSEKTGPSSPHYTGTSTMDGTTIYRNGISRVNYYNNAGSTTLTSAQAAEIMNSQSGTCTITGQDISTGTNARLERYDINLPYSPNNAHWVHTSVSPIASKYGVSFLNNVISTPNPSNIFEKLGMKPGDKGDK